MAKKPEAIVKDKIKAVMNGYYCVMYVPMGYGKAGVPDLIYCVNGVFFGIEAKYNKSKNKATELQIRNLKQIEDCGGVALIVDGNNVDSLAKLLAHFLSGEVEHGNWAALDGYEECRYDFS